MKKVGISDEAVEQSPPEAEARKVDRVVGSVLGVIAFIYATALFNVIFTYHRPYTTSGATHLLGLTTFTLLGVASYLTCVFCDPGAVPKDWTPDPEASAAVLHVKRSGAQRWCQKCDGPKPPRTHHCRRCRRCVLRMDHHCVWINNCVGHGNYRAFFQMALYLALAAAHATFLLLGLNAALVQLSLGWDTEAERLADKSTAAAIGSAVTDDSSSSGIDGIEGAAAADSLRLTVGRRVGWVGPFWAHALVQLTATAIAVPLCLSLVTLLVWNCHLLAHNKTTIEHHEGVAAKLNAAAAAEGVGAGRSGAHPWDLGDWHANVNYVFGDEVLGWVTPGRPSAEGTGTEFQTQWDNRRI